MAKLLSLDRARQEAGAARSPGEQVTEQVTGQATEEPHRFARYIRAVGRGVTLSRSLTLEEAEAAMGMILDGEVEPVQLGAFLLVLRYRKETPEELAGFVRAARARMAAMPGGAADIDWPSYADRHRQRPYFLLAALLLAGAGLRVLMHGIPGKGPATTPAAVRAFGLEPAADGAGAAATLARTKFAYLPLSAFCPALERLFALRPLFGLRSPANTFARELNPFDAPYQLQGVFHPTYLATHQETARLLGQPRAAVFKGGGGEVQCNPAKPCRVALLHEGAADEEIWPALTPRQHHAWREEDLDPAHLLGLWRGAWTAEGPVAAVLGTVAIALKLSGRANSRDEAQAMARALWDARDTGAY